MHSLHVYLVKQVGGGFLGTQDRPFTKLTTFNPILLLLTPLLPSPTTVTSVMSTKTPPASKTSKMITTHAMCYSVSLVDMVHKLLFTILGCL